MSYIDFISHLLLPTWGIHSTSNLWNSFYFQAMEFILLPTCGYIYSVPICDVYLLIWTWWHRLISGGNYLNCDARIIKYLFTCLYRMLSLTGVHQDTLYGSPDSKLSTPTFVSTPASVHLFLYLLQPQWTPNSPGFTPPDTVLSP